MRFLTLIFPLAPLLLFLTHTIARPWTPEDECPEKIKKLISGDDCEMYGGKYCTNEPRYDNMNDLHTVLSNCPNITSLDLRVTGLGCSDWPSRWTFPFNPAGGETYPRLKTLRLEGYDRTGREREYWHFPQNRYGYLDWALDILRWARSGNYKRWLEWRALPIEQQQKSNFALWLDAMDWSGIEELWLNRITDEIVEKLPSRLTSLHTLESTNLTFIEALPNNTLKNFTWIGSSKIQDLPAILSRQGQSLQSLEFRCPEIWCPSFPHEFDISILPNATRNLTHLSINVPRNGTWPLESFATIASLPNLRTVDLYLNIQSPCRQQIPYEYSFSQYEEFEREFGEDYCKGEDQFQRPFLDGPEALKLAEYMEEKNEGGKLEQVTFWVGDWTRSWDGPLYSPAWVEGRSAKIVCKISSRDVEQHNCTVEQGERYWAWKDAWGWKTSDWY